MVSNSIVVYGRGRRGIIYSFLVIFAGFSMYIIGPEFFGIFKIIFSIILLGLGFILLIYSSISKKIILNDQKIEYWFGNIKRYEIFWNEIINIENGPDKEDWTYYIEIKTKDKKILFDSDTLFRKKKLKKIFMKIVEFQDKNPSIIIKDQLEWLK